MSPDKGQKAECFSFKNDSNLEKSFNGYSPKLSVFNTSPSSSGIRRRQTYNKMKFSPNPDIDYSASSLLDFVLAEDDIFSVDVILDSYKFL